MSSAPPHPRKRRPVSSRGIRQVRSKLIKAGLRSISCDAHEGSVRLEGHVDSWMARVRAGYLAARVHCRGVINNLVVEGVQPPSMSMPEATGTDLDGCEYDVVVIGAGVIGCATARELSRHNLRVAVLEKEDDVGTHASSRNDGLIHPGFAPTPGTLKAWYNVEGNMLYATDAAELGFRCERVGSIVLFTKRWYWPLTPIMWMRSRQNRVAGPLRFFTRRGVLRREPNVTEKQHGGVFFPSAAVVNPFEVTIAYAENAAANGVEFHFQTVVTGLETTDAPGRITRITTNRGAVSAGVVINAAGVWSDVVAEMAGDRFYTIHGRRGVDVVLDKRLAGSQRHALSKPDLLGTGSSHTKGGGLIPSVHGNLIAGPTAEETPDREDYSTSADELERLEAHLALSTRVTPRAIITYFAGVRSATFIEDFIIEPSLKVNNLVHVAGIQSPGLASAPAIARQVASLATGVLRNHGVEVRQRTSFNPSRQSRTDVSLLTLEEREQLILNRPDYGRHVCRCEDVTEGEIRDALRSPLGVCSLDAIKRRTRAGAGRCHGGFCMPRILEIIQDETGLPPEKIRKKAGNSWVVAGRTKNREGRHA